MIVKSITPGDLRQMHDQEALILQGCGGDLTEWLEGINGILTEEEILKDGFRFEEAYTFKNEGLTCLMFRWRMGRKSTWVSSLCGASVPSTTLAALGSATM